MAIHYPDIEVTRPDTLGGGRWTLRDLNHVTVFFGKNGSGKSLLLRQWRDGQPIGSHYVAPERSGELDFQPQFGATEGDAEKRREGSTRNMVPEYRRRILGRIQAYLAKRGAFRGQGTAPGTPNTIERQLKVLFPDFDITIHAKIPPYEFTRIDNSQAIVGLDQLSSGEAQLLMLGLDLTLIASIWELESQSKRLLLIDEPDAHLHPDLQCRLAALIVELTDKFNIQVAVATHSTSLLSALGQFGGTRTSIVCLQRSEAAFRAAPFDKYRQQVASCLGGHILMGPLFGEPILLVEGSDDYQIWSHAPRLHKIRLAVIPCNGQEIFQYRETLETIVGSIRDDLARPVGYALLDSDKIVPLASHGKQPRHFLFLKLKCHESENLYLTDEVLQLAGLTWDELCEKVERLATERPDCWEGAASIRSWERMTCDAKPWVKRIASDLDARGIPWTIRVGQALGAGRPTGQLAEFLGTEVVSALWGEAKEN